MPKFVVVTVQEWEAGTAEQAAQEAREVQAMYEGESFVYAGEPDNLAHPEQLPDTFLSRKLG